MVASSAITSEGRAVLSMMATGPSEIKGTAAEAIFVKPNRKIDFNVAVEQYCGGRLTVLS